MSRLKGGRSYSVERNLNLNGSDTSLIWTYSQVGRKCCFHNQRAMLHAQRYTPSVRALYRLRTALVMTVNELHVFLSSQLKQENARSKGSESGKRCTRACTSHVASGVENGQVARPFAEYGILHTFAAAPRVA